MLRDYQVDICKRVREAFDTHRSVMVQMPTGTGKTVVLAELVKQFLQDNTERTVVIVAHRKELVKQIQETLKKVLSFENTPVPSCPEEGLHLSPKSSPLSGEDLKPGRQGLYEQASFRPQGVTRELPTQQSCDCFIWVQSIQWLSRYINKVGKNPDLVIVDEAHHALAQTYKMMWEAWPEAKFLGLTATPCRMNGKGFTDLFEVLVQSWDIPTFIKAKWLAKYDFVSIKADSHTQQLINSLKLRGKDGDYQNREMDDVLNKRPSIELLYGCFAKYAKDRKGIVYAFNIDHAKAIADYYKSQGVLAVDISSKTPENERKWIIEQFRAGTLQVLVSVDLFSEGFDCPDVEFIQLARPTLSLAKYLQMVGRGLRIAKGKEDCMIIDNVGLYRVFGLPSQEWDWIGMFEGVKADRYKSNNKLSSLINNQQSITNHQSLDNEMYLVVNHDQLEQTFESQKEDGKISKVRGDLLSGKLGEIKRIGRQLLELQPLNDKRPVFVDLLNMHFFRTEEDERPSIVKYGGVEFIKHIPILESRTKQVLMLTEENRCIACTSFYSEFQLLDEDESCLKWNFSEWSHGSDTVVFLHDDTTEYYLTCCHLTDGSIVIMDADGNYYRKREGQPRENIGRADTSEEEAALKTKIENIQEEINLKVAKEKAAKLAKEACYVNIEPYRQGMKWGLRASSGRVVVPPIYRSIHAEHDYYTFENLPLHWGVMDKKGKVLIEPKHDKVEITPDGKAILTTVTGRQTIIDLKSPQK